MSGEFPSTGIFDQFLSRARRFYAPAPVVLRAMELAGEMPIDCVEIARCVDGDPLLAAKIVRLANCSLFGTNRPVHSVEQIPERLGAESFHLLMLGCSVPTAATTDLAPEMKSLFWHYFLLAAAASSEIASTWYRMLPLESFAGGVTRGLGILALVHELGDSYANFLLGVWESIEDLSTHEARVLGFDHGHLGAKLFEQQGLPANLAAVLTLSRDSVQLDALDPARRSNFQVLCLADLVARLFANDRIELLEVLFRTGQEYCGMTVARLAELVLSLEQKVPELAVALGVEPPVNTSYSRMLQNAHRRLREMTEADYHESPTSSPADGSPLIIADDVAWNDSGRANGESLTNRISGAVARCRQARCPLSLVLTQVDNPRFGLDSPLRDSSEKMIQRINSAIHEVAKGDSRPTRVSNTRFALILEKYDRRHAVELAWKIVDTVRTWSDDTPEESWSGLTVSVGLATLTMPPRNFPAEQMVTAAQRCLNGVQLSGGDGVKSIDII